MDKTGYDLYAKILMIICMVIILNGCSTNEMDFGKDIVARVGNQKITAKEFQLNYEFGFSHLKKEPDRKFSYLENMISEKLLVLEGYRLNLDKSERVQNREKKLLEELLIEELFLKEVSEKVQISPQEIETAISKSNIHFKLRYWVVPSLKVAEEVNGLIQEKGFADVLQENGIVNGELKQYLNHFETDYLTWLEVAPELLNEIKDLEIGDISKPVEIDQVFLTLQVIDIKSGILSDSDYKNMYKRFKGILFSRKLKKETARYVSQFMEPKNIVTKASAFTLLVNALAEWKTDSLSNSNFQADLDKADVGKPALLKLKNNPKEILISFANGSWSLGEFIIRFDPNSIKSSPLNKGSFKQEINHQIAMTILNYFLVKEAIADGLDESATVEMELEAWREKWVYEETRQYLTRDILISKNDARKYFEENLYHYQGTKGSQATFEECAHNARQDAYIESRQVILKKKVQALKDEYPVLINKELLAKIPVTDFKKSRWANLLLYRSGSSRSAVPVVDPSWNF